MATIRHILVPIDDSGDDSGSVSAASTEAAEYACRLALSLGAGVTLLHVFEAPSVALGDALYAATPAELRALAARAAHELEDLAAALARPGLALDWEIAEGLPAEQILAVAARDAVDLIVMGTHGRHGIARLLVGSVAARVVRTAHCPVLTIGPQLDREHGMAQDHP